MLSAFNSCLLPSPYVVFSCADVEPATFSFLFSLQTKKASKPIASKPSGIPRPAPSAVGRLLLLLLSPFGLVFGPVELRLSCGLVIEVVDELAGPLPLGADEVGTDDWGISEVMMFVAFASTGKAEIPVALVQA